MRKAADFLIKSFGLNEALRRARQLESRSVVREFARAVRLEVERRSAAETRSRPAQSPQREPDSP